MADYTLLRDQAGNPSTLRIPYGRGHKNIPLDPANGDYQAYKRAAAAGDCEDFETDAHEVVDPVKVALEAAAAASRA